MEPRVSLITLGVADIARSILIYRDGLKFRTNAKDGDQEAYFATAGTMLGLYPLEKLSADIGAGVKLTGGPGGITLAHTVKTREEVAAVLDFAARAGARILKPAQAASWGGHAGYFSDLDGYCWEVAWNPHSKFDAAGNLLI